MFKLGRKPTIRDARTFRLVDLMGVLPGVPMARDWPWIDLDQDGRADREIRFDMFGNDRAGCCTIAAIAHHEHLVSWLHEDPRRLETKDVYELYKGSGWDGNPGSDSDEGWACVSALNAARKAGVIKAFASLDNTRTSVELAIDKFAACYVGADLPIAAQRQRVWDVAPAGKHDDTYKPRSWGGHAMTAVAYDRTGVTLVTWGRLQRATWEWFFTYVDERYVIFNSRWLSGKYAPSGFGQDRLDALLAKI